MKEIKGVYHVADCEHEGDMRNAANEINSIGGCEITDSYWDGEDCGEAYIEFKFSSNIFQKVYEKFLGNTVYYDDDINNYIETPKAKGVLSKALKVKYSDFVETCHEVTKDMSILFNGKIYISLLFNDSDYGTEVVEYAIKTLGKNTTSIRCYSSDIVDGCLNYHVLLLADISKVNERTINDISGSYGWFRRHHIFGDVCIQSDLSYYMGVENKYSNLRDMVEHIRNKENLRFKQGYYGREVEVSYNEYMCGNEFKTRIKRDEKTYSLMNYRRQFKNTNK